MPARLKSVPITSRNQVQLPNTRQTGVLFKRIVRVREVQGHDRLAAADLLSELPSTLGRRKKQARFPAPVGLTDENDGQLLPTDVLYEVLLRVSAKELCRLRLVCRSWRSLTSDPGFAKAHTSRHPLLVAGTWNNTEVHLLDLSCCNSIVRRLHVPERLHHLSSDVGLICVSPTIGELSYVLDPVSGEVVATLPDAAEDVDLQPDDSFLSVLGLDLDVLSDPELFRGSSPSLLDHVPSTGEYKALRTNRYCTDWDGDQERITQTCNVITVSTAATAGGSSGAISRWRAQPCPPVGGPSCLRDRVVLDGVAYFLRRPCYDYYNLLAKYSKDFEPDTIFAFDLATEEWRPNTLRGPLSSNTSSDNDLEFSRERESLQLCVLDGCLVTAHHTNWDCSMDLWFLEGMDDTDKGFWNKRYSIQCVSGCEYRHSSKPPCPLHILEGGRIVMWGAQQETVLALLVYDPRTNRYAQLASMEDYGSVSMHLGSLLCSSSLQS